MKQEKGRSYNILEGSILTIIAGVLLLLLFGALGYGGNILAKSLIGIFGYSIYGIAFAMLTIGGLRFFKFTPSAKGMTILGSILMYIFFVAIFHTATSESYLQGYSSYISQCYKGSNTAGGALFAMIIYPIAKLNAIFAIVLFSLLFIAAAGLTFMNQLGKLKNLKIFSGNDSATALADSKVTRGVTQLHSDLTTAKLDGTQPKDKIGYIRNRRGHDQIKSLEELDGFIEVEGGSESYDDVIVLGNNQPKFATPLDIHKDVTASMQPKSQPQKPFDHALKGLYGKQEVPPSNQPQNPNGELTVEQATKTLYSGQMTKPTYSGIATPQKIDVEKKDIEMTDIMRLYTNNGRMEELQKNSRERKGQVNTNEALKTQNTAKDTIAESHTTHKYAPQPRNITGKNGTIGYAPDSVWGISPKKKDDENVSQENPDIDSSFGDNTTNIDSNANNSFVNRENNANIDNRRVNTELTTSSIQAVPINSTIADKYRKLKESNPIDKTARDKQATESFVDVIAVDNLRTTESRGTRGNSYKETLEDSHESLASRRRERSDKGGSHVSPSRESSDNVLGTGIDFGLANNVTIPKGVQAPDVIPPMPTQKDIDERRMKTRPKLAPYKAPNIGFLNSYQAAPEENEDFTHKIEILEKTLKSFNYEAKVVNVITGPTFSRLELTKPEGVSVQKINGFVNDIAMCLEVSSVRVLTPIPGKNLFGIEIPNSTRGTVGLKEIFDSPQFNQNKDKLSFGLGQDIEGNNYVIDITKAPHMLIAGATGAGKSVCINTLICSIIYKYSPEYVKLILVDPKQVELSRYNGLPHMLTRECITSKDQVVAMLDWVIAEMESRYGLFKENRATEISEYNQKAATASLEKIPYIVVIIDEVADLVLSLKKEFEERVVRLTQKARAAGIALILATQRPSVDVITGTIKGNLPTRIAFAVPGYNDSKTILDCGGAEKLLRYGDMLYSASSDPSPKRIQGAFISNEEVNSIVDYVCANNESYFDPEIEEAINKKKQQDNKVADAASVSKALADREFVLALKYVVENQEYSSSKLIRRFQWGFPKAARLLDEMENMGYISQMSSNNKREIYLTMEEFLELYGDFEL